MDLVIDRSEMHKKDKALAIVAVAVIAAIAAIRIANRAVTGEDMLKVQQLPQLRELEAKLQQLLQLQNPSHMVNSFGHL